MAPLFQLLRNITEFLKPENIMMLFQLPVMSSILLLIGTLVNDGALLLTFMQAMPKQKWADCGEEGIVWYPDMERIPTTIAQAQWMMFGNE